MARPAPSARNQTDLPIALARKGNNFMARYRFQEREEIAEILRILSAKPLHFRLQFLGAPDATGTTVRNETSIWASDAPTAVGMAVGAPLPADTAGIRVLDPAGSTIFERQNADFCGL